MVKPNYQYEKRQRDIAKKKKKEEKKQASMEKKILLPDTALEPDVDDEALA